MSVEAPTGLDPKWGSSSGWVLHFLPDPPRTFPFNKMWWQQLYRFLSHCVRAGHLGFVLIFSQALWRVSSLSNNFGFCSWSFDKSFILSIINGNNPGFADAIIKVVGFLPYLNFLEVPKYSLLVIELPSLGKGALCVINYELMHYGLNKTVSLGKYSFYSTIMTIYVSLKLETFTNFLIVYVKNSIPSTSTDFLRFL